MKRSLALRGRARATSLVLRGEIRLPDLRQIVASQQLGQDEGIDLVGFDLASAMAFVFKGLPTTNRATQGLKMSTIGHVFVVASNAT